MRHDPRIRQNLDHLTTAFEAAADETRLGCFTICSRYIEPCLSSLSSCIPRRRRFPPTPRPPDFPFGFYEYDEFGDHYGSSGGGGGYGAGPSSGVGGNGIFRWGTDELDRLLAGTGAVGLAPPERERMVYPSYGTLPLPLALSQPPVKRAETKKEDPTVIPGTSYLGFLSRFGRKGMKYKPSAANLQEHPQRGRRRSATDSSLGDSGDSLRSRGEIWPSEDELDDAVVLGDDGWERGLGLGLETPTRGFFRDEVHEGDEGDETEGEGISKDAAEEEDLLDFRDPGKSRSRSPRDLEDDTKTLTNTHLGANLHQERGYSSAPTTPLLGSRTTSGSSSPKPPKRGKRGKDKEKEPQMRQVSGNSVRSAQTVLVRTVESQAVVGIRDDDDDA